MSATGRQASTRGLRRQPSIRRLRRQPSIRRLRRQLQHVGALPPPGPRPEFGDQLIARLLAEGRPHDVRRVGGAAPLEGGGAARGGVHDLDARRARRRPAATYARRAAAAVSIAAAAAGVFGVADMVGDGDSGDGVTAALAAQIGGRSDVEIGPEGQLLDSNRRPAGVQDGPAQMTCDRDLVFSDATGQAYRCTDGETVVVHVRGDAIVRAEAATAAPVVGAIELFPPPLTDGPRVWSWKAYDGLRFDHYELIRVPGITDDAAMPGQAVVFSSADVAVTTFTETPPLPAPATYQLRVYDAAGELRAQSDLLQLVVGQPVSTATTR